MHDIIMQKAKTFIKTSHEDFLAEIRKGIKLKKVEPQLRTRRNIRSSQICDILQHKIDKMRSSFLSEEITDESFLETSSDSDSQIWDD